MDVKLTTVAEMKSQVGSDIFFDLVDQDLITTERTPKERTFAEYKQSVFARTGVPPNRQRYWKFVNRQNNTRRPVVLPLSFLDEDTTIEMLRDQKYASSGGGGRQLRNEHVNHGPLKLLLEVVSLEESVAHAETLEDDYTDARAFSNHERALILKTVAPALRETNVNIHLKFYDPRNETLAYLGSLTVHMDSTVDSLADKIRHLAGVRAFPILLTHSTD